jgi:hypothetical protein
MKRLARYLATVGGSTALIVAMTAGTPADARSPHPRTVLSFDTMFANVAPFIGAPGAIRGVNAAPLPWKIGDSHGTLSSNGQLDIDVDRLTLANDPSVPAALRGTNPLPFFAAIVSCLSSSNGAEVTANVTTANFAASMPQGNASIRQKLTLPSPCVAPIVLVTSPNGGFWFATTGQ